MVKCWASLPLRRFIQWRAEVWGQRNQQCVRNRDRPGARHASEMVIWWNWELRILNGIVNGFFEEEEGEAERPGARVQRYRNSSLSEVSDPEQWRSYHHFDESSSESEAVATDEQGRTRYNIWGDVGAQEVPAEEGHGRDVSHSEPDAEPDEYHELRTARESALRVAMERQMDAFERGDVEAEILYERQVNFLSCFDAPHRIDSICMTFGSLTV